MSLGHALKSQRDFGLIVALLCVSIFPGCPEDQRGADWTNPQPTGDAGDVGMDVQQPDTCAPGDLDQLSNDDEPPQRDMLAIPDQPPEDAHCNDNGWCWIHPTPFPQRVTDLRKAGQQVLGVASFHEFPAYKGVIWDDEGMELFLPESVHPKDLVDMTTTEDGWLALGEFGKVYDIRPDGLQESVTLERGKYRAISGNSMDDFMAAMRDDWKVVVDGEVKDGPRVTRGVESRMWPNGDIVSIDPIDRTQTGLDGRWRKLPAPTPIFPDSAVGPRPGGACGAAYPAIASRRDLLTWTGALPWQRAAESEYPLTSLGCSVEGRLLVGDQRGALYERTGKECPAWDSTRILGQPIHDTMVSGSKLFVTGAGGAHAIVEDGAVDRVGRGLSFPAPVPTEDHPPGIRGLRSQAEGTQLAIETETDRIMVTPSGVTRTKVSDRPARPDPAFADESAGGDPPAFIADDGRLYERRGFRWVDRTERVIGSESGYAIELAGHTPNNVWLGADESLYHYDGVGWTSVERPEEITDVGELEVGPEGKPYLNSWNDRDLYTRTHAGDGGAWVRIDDLPAHGINDLFIASNGDVWIVGEHAVFRYSAGKWDDYGPRYDAFFADNLVSQGDTEPPIVASGLGLLEPQPDGSLELLLTGEFRSGIHLEERDITLVYTRGAIAAHYDDL